MNELTYTLYPDGIEYASFGGNVRTREYIENWPFVETDGKEEVFALDGYLPYPISPTLARIFKDRGITDTEQLRAAVGDSCGVFDITLHIALGAQAIDTSPVSEVEFYVALGLTAQQILEVFIEADNFHKAWEKAHSTDWANSHQIT